MSRSTTAAVRFDAAVCAIGSTLLVRLPEQASAAMPSRGQVAVHASVNGKEVCTVLEPDGRRGHWIKLDQDCVQLSAGDAVDIAIDVLPDWPEPDVPADLSQALADAPREIRDVWSDITPMARWEWVRWVQATANPATRRRRIEVGLSKLSSGKRRPCCFDLSACTDPSVARSGKLRDADRGAKNVRSPSSGP